MIDISNDRIFAIDASLVETFTKPYVNLGRPRCTHRFVDTSRDIISEFVKPLVNTVHTSYAPDEIRTPCLRLIDFIVNNHEKYILEYNMKAIIHMYYLANGAHVFYDKRYYAVDEQCRHIIQEYLNSRNDFIRFVCKYIYNDLDDYIFNNYYRTSYAEFSAKLKEFCVEIEKLRKIMELYETIDSGLEVLFTINNDVSDDKLFEIRDPAWACRDAVKDVEHTYENFDIPEAHRSIMLSNEPFAKYFQNEERANMFLYHDVKDFISNIRSIECNIQSCTFKSDRADKHPNAYIDSEWLNVNILEAIRNDPVIRTDREIDSIDSRQHIYSIYDYNCLYIGCCHKTPLEEYFDDDDDDLFD